MIRGTQEQYATKTFLLSLFIKGTAKIGRTMCIVGLNSFVALLSSFDLSVHGRPE